MGQPPRQQNHLAMDRIGSWSTYRKAEEHVRKGTELLERQRAVIEERRRDGYDVKEAERLLVTMQQLQKGHLDHLERVRRDLAELDGASAVSRPEPEVLDVEDAELRLWKPAAPVPSVPVLRYTLTYGLPFAEATFDNWSRLTCCCGAQLEWIGTTPECAPWVKRHLPCYAHPRRLDG